jgi:aspartate kinase
MLTVEKTGGITGSNMDQPGVLAKAAGALAASGISIQSGGFSFRKINIQFIVSREDYLNTIVALNTNMNK